MWILHSGNHIKKLTNLFHILLYISLTSNWKLIPLNNLFIIVSSIDKVLGGFFLCDLESLLNKTQSETNGLSEALSIKNIARVILTIKTNINDQLILGQTGATVAYNLSANNSVGNIKTKVQDENGGFKVKHDNISLSRN